MTGIPHFNFPAFDAMASDLRAMGHDVVSPSELDDEETRKTAYASKHGRITDMRRHGTWGDFLARDVKLLTDDGIEGVVVLPGWERSKGARLETFVAFLNGIPIYRLTPAGALSPVRTMRLASAWAFRTLDGFEPSH
jgi:hypothetical protein